MIFYMTKVSTITLIRPFIKNSVYISEHNMNIMNTNSVFTKDIMNVCLFLNWTDWKIGINWVLEDIDWQLIK